MRKLIFGLVALALTPAAAAAVTAVATAVTATFFCSYLDIYRDIHI